MAARVLRPIGLIRLDASAAISLALMLGGYGLRTVLRAELNRNGSADLTPVDTRALPSLDVVVAARDEEGVVTRLVERLTSVALSS